MNLFNFIKQKISILDVVMNYSSLKKAGSYYKGRCPFHHEKTASFTVSPEKEIFYCFGCHIGGDVISFISKVENCSQFEAAKLLSEQYNIEIPSSITSKNEVNNQLKDNYINLCQSMAMWCHKNLLSNKNAQEYLYSRSINSESINNFMLGYFFYICKKKMF
jgi:DNA primase